MMLASLASSSQGEGPSAQASGPSSVNVTPEGPVAEGDRTPKGAVGRAVLGYAINAKVN